MAAVSGSQIMTLAEKLSSFLHRNQKELKTIWRIERGGYKGYLAGTAHFFPYRFQKSLQRLIREAKIVLFEGPLDQQSMNQVVERGSEGEGSVTLYERLDPQTITQVKKCPGIYSDGSNPLPLFFPLGSKESDPLYAHFQKFRPWLAFLNLWSQYLKGKGWKYSVDLEAWGIAAQMGKEIHYLETIEEQVKALEGVPFERFVNFLKKIHRWDEYTKAHVQSYLKGDLEEMMSGTSEFPTRCPAIIENRDPVFYDRLRPHLEKAETVAFIGTAHIPGLKKLFLNDGYKVNQLLEMDE